MIGLIDVEQNLGKNTLEYIPINHCLIQAEYIQYNSNKPWVTNRDDTKNVLSQVC